MAESTGNLRLSWRVGAAFVRRELLEQTVHWTPMVLSFIAFGIGLLSQAYLGRMVDTGSSPVLGDYAGHYAAFLLLGIAMLDLQSSVISSLASRIRDAQQTGSLEALLATPTPMPLVLAGVALPDLLSSLGRLLLYAGLGMALFGLRFGGVSLVGLLAILAAASLAFATLALIGAAVTMVLRRGDPVNLLIAALSMIAGGVLYPQRILPGPLARLGRLLPISPALDGLRALVVQHQGLSALVGPLTRLGAVVLVAGPLGAALFAWALRHARAEGSLTAY